MESKKFSSPDEVKSLEKTEVAVVRLPGVSVARFTFQPGWKWSECVGPKLGSQWCPVHHVGAVVSGSVHIVSQDGASMDIGPGDAYVIPPGHDAWVTSDEPFVGFEFEGAEEFAKPA